MQPVKNIHTHEMSTRVDLLTGERALSLKTHSGSGKGAVWLNCMQPGVCLSKLFCSFKIPLEIQDRLMFIRLVH